MSHPELDYWGSVAFDEGLASDQDDSNPYSLGDEPESYKGWKLGRAVARQQEGWEGS